jgi:hypothetical protein
VKGPGAPRRHHTLPVFYQARFADENRRIVGIRRDDLSRRVETTPANLASLGWNREVGERVPFESRRTTPSTTE